MSNKQTLLEVLKQLFNGLSSGTTLLDKQFSFTQPPFLPQGIREEVLKVLLTQASSVRIVEIKKQTVYWLKNPNRLTEADMENMLTKKRTKKEFNPTLLMGVPTSERTRLEGKLTIKLDKNGDDFFIILPECGFCFTCILDTLPFDVQRQIKNVSLSLLELTLETAKKL